MNPIAAIRTEYSRYRRLVELALEQVEDQHLDQQPDANSNSIAVVMGHLIGNLKSPLHRLPNLGWRETLATA